MRGVYALALAAAGLMGCASTRGKQANPEKPAATTLSGTWEGLSRSVVSDGGPHATAPGDTRIERHAWQLEQRGDRVVGFYVVELTMVSGDGRPYVCSRSPEFTTLLRFDLRGMVAPGGAAVLEETGDMKVKGDCQPAGRQRHRYLARLRGNVLTLTDGPRHQTLYRRVTEAGANGGTDLAAIRFDDPRPTIDAPALTSSLGDEEPEAPDGSEQANLQGFWVWENRGVLPTGDEKHEREEWHISQNGTMLTGYYDRSIRQVSLDGMAYRCNGALDFEIVTRYQVSGEIRNGRVVLREQAYEILQGSPCDDGRRRLDAYQGRATPDEIRLIWGVGQQVLRRGRPDVPTQRF
jgi:hypothetical protein